MAPGYLSPVATVVVVVVVDWIHSSCCNHQQPKIIHVRCLSAEIVLVTLVLVFVLVAAVVEIAKGLLCVQQQN